MPPNDVCRSVKLEARSMQLLRPVATGSEPVAAGAESSADLVLAEIEAALAMRRAGADPKALRRALRRIEELLDE
jgi:hypothetical protein